MTVPTRRGLAPFAVIALLPTVAALLLVRPAPAAGQAVDLGLYSMTVVAASTNTTGDIGAGGGLAPVDSGAPVVRGRVDSSPTTSVLAAPVEPGTLFRTVASLANNEVPDEEPLQVQAAQASYPGGPAEDRAAAEGATQDGPFTSTAVAARASADDRAVAGEAEAAEQDLTGDGAVLRQRQARSAVEATASPGDGTLVATATSSAASVTVAEVLTFEDVVGRATLRHEDGSISAEAGTTFGGVRVADTPVELSNDGVVVGDDAPLLPGQEAATLEDQVNGVLEAAGIEVEPLSPVREGGERSGRADSGGVRVSITSPSSGAVPANTVEVVIGQATATMSVEPAPDAAELPPMDAPDVDAPKAGSEPVASVDTAPAPGDSSVEAPSTASAPPSPDVAGPAPSGTEEEPSVLVAGRQLPRRTALALLGGWQLLSLSTCTLAAFALRGGQGWP